MSVTPVDTGTAKEQARVEKLVRDTYADTAQCGPEEELPLMRLKHARYCRMGLESLPQGMSSLDASRPWLCYWMVHSLELLSAPIDEVIAARLVDFLGTRCQDEAGGFAGGPGQLAHLAPTYAAVNTLVTIGTPEALQCIRRPQLYRFLQGLKNSDGSFSLHAMGESDVRGTYTAVSVAMLTCIADDALFAGTAEWIARCQTYEGGIGGEPGNEAHGGYTFCGVAALALLGRSALLNQPRLMRWLAARQLPFEGGFQGRTHKLVDSCYSFWQAAVPSMLNFSKLDQGTEWYDRQRLQQWLLCCCQDNVQGGLCDKPDRPRDYYHTCYSLSGLSLAQHGWQEPTEAAVQPREEPRILGLPSNLLIQVEPRYNVSLAKVNSALEFFSSARHDS